MTLNAQSTHALIKIRDQSLHVSRWLCVR